MNIYNTSFKFNGTLRVSINHSITHTHNQTNMQTCDIYENFGRFQKAMCVKV